MVSGHECLLKVAEQLSIDVEEGPEEIICLIDVFKIPILSTYS